MVTVVPTLAAMAEIYQLSRSGGVKSPGLQRIALARSMSGGSRDTIRWLDRMHSMRSTSSWRSTRRHVLARRRSRSSNDASSRATSRWQLSSSPGMWTDRVATEVRHRTSAKRRAGHGEILLWTGDVLDAGLVLREAAAETVRVMWTTLHGAADTLGALLAREGLAYALASNPYGPSSPLDDATVAEGITVLGDTSTLGDIVAVLYGDAVASCLGWTPIGLAEHAGYRWAIARSAARIVSLGAAEALLERAWNDKC